MWMLQTMMDTPPYTSPNGHAARVPVKELGADVDVRSNAGDAPIHLAVKLGHIEAVRALQELGAAVDVANHDGNTSLHLAALRGQAVGIRI